MPQGICTSSFKGLAHFLLLVHFYPYSSTESFSTIITGKYETRLPLNVSPRNQCLKIANFFLSHPNLRSGQLYSRDGHILRAKYFTWQFFNALLPETVVTDFFQNRTINYSCPKVPARRISKVWLTSFYWSTFTHTAVPNHSVL